MGLVLLLARRRAGELTSSVLFLLAVHSALWTFGLFGSAGYPRQQPPLGTQPAGSWWIGQAMNSGSQTYQIQIAVTVGVIQPVTYYVNWDPFITAQ